MRSAAGFAAAADDDDDDDDDDVLVPDTTVTAVVGALTCTDSSSFSSIIVRWRFPADNHSHHLSHAASLHGNVNGEQRASRPTAYCCE